MTKSSKITSALAALALTGSMAVAVPTMAYAADDSAPVTSSRSFHKMSVVRKDLLQESTSARVDAKSNWGGVESLNVPQTQSQAEKDAATAAAAKKAADAATAAASRSAVRESLGSASTLSVTPPNGTTAAALVAYATQFESKVPYVSGGNTPAGWDCSGFVQYVFAQFGVSLPHYSGAQAQAGRAVPSIDEAMPGDILANGTHAAIYLGNGMLINAADEQYGTCIKTVGWPWNGASYQIRRVL